MKRPVFPETTVQESDVSCSGSEIGPSFLDYASPRGEAPVRSSAAFLDDAD